MQADRYSGGLLIGGAAVVLLAMAHHPTGHAVAASPEGAGRISVLVHAVAIAALPVLFAGLVGLSRRLGWSPPAITALSVYGFSVAAGIAAAVFSGFVATPLLEELPRAEGAREAALRELVRFSGLANHGFAAVLVTGWGVAMLLWAAAMLSRPGALRGLGFGAAVGGAAILVGFLSGHLGLDVHGFLMMSGLHAAWLIWAGIVLCLPPPEAPRSRGADEPGASAVPGALR